MDKTSKLYAERLIGLIADLGVPYRHKPSLRFSRAHLGADRMVLTVTPASIREHHGGRLLEVCRRLEMPEVYLARVVNALNDRCRLHFGFEEALGNFVFKMELEQAAPEASTVEAVPMHRTFRWGAGHPVASASQFQWLPHLSPARVMRRVEGIYCGAASPPRALLRELSDWKGAQRYLEEEEEGWGRRAFHLEFPDRGPRLRDLSQALTDTALRYQVPRTTVERILEKLDGQPLRRVAGGFRADGHEFLTLSYGIDP